MKNIENILQSYDNLWSASLFIFKLAMFVIGWLLAAVMLRAAVRIVLKCKLPYREACWITLWRFIIGWIIGVVFPIIISLIIYLPMALVSEPGFKGADLKALLIAVTIMAVWLGDSWLIGSMVGEPDSSKTIGFKRGCTVGLVYLALGFALWLIYFAVYSVLAWIYG
jgi:hypothetical protein